MKRRHNRTNRPISVEFLEHRSLPAATFVAVDFHNHFFSHYGETAQNDATAASNWKTQLPASRRQQDIETILQTASMKTSLPEFVGFSEHAGYSLYNNPTEVRDLEAKLAAYLGAITNQPPAFGGTVGIELTPQNSAGHLGVPFLNVATFNYSSGTSFGFGRLVEVAGLSPLIWNHPAGSIDAGAARSTLQDFRNFMDNAYTSNFRNNATVKNAVAAIEFPRNMNADFAIDFKFTERAMVAATVDGFWLTPTLGSDSHTQYSFNGSALKLEAPFTSPNPSAQAVKAGTGLLEFDVLSNSKYIPEADGKAALQSRRGSVVYQPSATIRVDGNGGTREGSKVTSLPPILTVSVTGFPVNTLARVEAHYVLKNSITATTKINMLDPGDDPNQPYSIKRVECTPNASKTAFTFSTANRGNIAFVYFVAYDSGNTPIAITAPTIVTGSSTAVQGSTAIRSGIAVGFTSPMFPPQTANTAPLRTIATARADQRNAVAINNPEPTTSESTKFMSQPSRNRSAASNLDTLFEDIGTSGLLEILVPLL